MTVSAVAVVLITVTRLAAGYDVLAIFPFSGKSHFHMFRAIADALVDGGHDVTVVGHFPAGAEGSGRGRGDRPEGAGTYTDYSVAGSVPVFENFTVDQFSGFGYLEQFLVILQDGLDNCEGVMSSGRLDELVRARAKFDLVLVEVRSAFYVLRKRARFFAEKRVSTVFDFFSAPGKQSIRPPTTSEKKNVYCRSFVYCV